MRTARRPRDLVRRPRSRAAGCRPRPRSPALVATVPAMSTRPAAISSPRAPANVPVRAVPVRRRPVLDVPRQILSTVASAWTRTSWACSSIWAWREIPWRRVGGVRAVARAHQQRVDLGVDTVADRLATRRPGTCSPGRGIDVLIADNASRIARHDRHTARPDPATAMPHSATHGARVLVDRPRAGRNRGSTRQHRAAAQRPPCASPTGPRWTAR